MTRKTAGMVAAALLASCSAGTRESRPVEIRVTRNGFEPARVRAVRGQPLDLVVTRTTDDTCATEIVIPDAGLTVPLPLGRPVHVTFTPKKSGALRYSCAMGMFGGVVDVE